MRIGAGKYLLLRGGGGEGPGLRAEIKTAVSAAFAGGKRTLPPGRKPFHGTVGRAAVYPLPLFSNGIAAGERGSRKASIGCQICGYFFVGWSKGIPLSAWRRREGLELWTVCRAKRRWRLPPLLVRRVSPLPGQRPLRGTAAQTGGRPLPLFPNGIAAEGKRDNRKASIDCQICGDFFAGGSKEILPSARWR